MSKFWDEWARKIDRERFRAHGQYLWAPPEFPYEALARAVYEANLGYWIDRLGEDGAFHCPIARVDGQNVSRDLLDSIFEIHFISRYFMATNVRILDIGAGYGRLLHRLYQFWKLLDEHDNLTLMATDTVDVSVECCRKYLEYRKVPCTIVHARDRFELGPIDLAMNVHSFSECTPDEVRDWISWLAAKRVANLFIVPHPYSSPEILGGNDLKSIIESYGYRVHETWMQQPACWKRDFYMFRLEK